MCIIATKTSECYLISACPPTLEKTMRNPNKTRIYYEQLSSLINSITQGGALVIGGDFNKKGNLLIEFCKLHNLLITNTIYKHKPSHQTTWISPLPSIPYFLG